MDGRGCVFYLCVHWRDQHVAFQLFPERWIYPCCRLILRKYIGFSCSFHRYYCIWFRVFRTTVHHYRAVNPAASQVLWMASLQKRNLGHTGSGGSLGDNSVVIG